MNKLGSDCILSEGRRARASAFTLESKLGGKAKLHGKEGALAVYHIGNLDLGLRDMIVSIFFNKSTKGFQVYKT